MSSIANCVAALAVAASAREITFPPVSGVQHPMAGADINASPIFPGLDISSALYAGLSTYANLPYVHCLAGEGEDVEPYDIAILGAPFDTVCCILAPWYLGTC